MSEVIVDFDNSWKQGLEDFFAEFLELLFPEIYDLIDWEKPIESKEQELQQVIREGDRGKQITDKLFKVSLKSEETVWIFIHTEVQNQEDTEFVERMWRYHYRLRDRYQERIINLAVLGDRRKSWRPSSYHY
ncbi:MAG: transposase, partial [Kamptonema sp. SIO4C4]|nr:transposase [Kamptonema sp. SIO4C4]